MLLGLRVPRALKLCVLAVKGLAEVVWEGMEEAKLPSGETVCHLKNI